ncbi:MAG: hypothetical protein M3P49_13370 [Actinomycetota bacterium]|nr:hypothetical protein [Actinomycetota bacterium]
MKRNASLALGLLAWLAVLSGCAGLGGSSASCGWDAPRVEPERARPGEDFVFRGWGFGGGCDDSNMPDWPEPPQQDVRIEMRQGGRTWDLATVDAEAPPDFAVEATLGVPEDAEPGGALVTTDEGPDDPFGSLEVPFEVLSGPKTGFQERDEPVASGVAASCAAGTYSVRAARRSYASRMALDPRVASFPLNGYPTLHLALVFFPIRGSVVGSPPARPRALRQPT